MIHSSAYDPRVYPYKGNTVAAAQIDRVQEITASITMNRTKIEEVGREGLVDWRQSIPGISLTIRQLEYGTIEFWKKLSNAEADNTKVEWKDYKTPQVDIAAYETDDSGTFKSTTWYPNLRLASFSLTIGDPEALLERNFSLVGEDEMTLQGTNKYLIYLQDESASGASHTIEIGAGSFANYPAPVADPDESGSSVYILKLVKVTSANVATTLVLTTDYTYNNGSTTITIPGSESGDTFKVWYSSGSYITGTDPFTNNDSDAAGLTADMCSIYLATTNYLFRLQNVSLDVTFDRNDIREIGNDEVVARGVRDINTRIVVGRLLEEWTIEEILRGVAADYPKINIRKFSSNINLVVKIYSDETKGTFLLGYALTDLAPTGLDNGAPVNDYITRGTTLEGEAGFVTTVENDLDTL